MKSYLFVLFQLICVGAFSQGLNFQGVARGSNSTIVASAKIALRFSILSNSPTGTAEYVETKTANTNGQGVFAVVIGDSSIYATTGTFSNINWKEPVKYLKVEMDIAGGSNFITMGTTQLQNVPYSFYSLGVDAANVNGILPIAKGGTGVSTLAQLKTALGVDWTVKDTAVFNKDILVNELTVGKGNNSVYANTVLGIGALKNNINGNANTAVGDSALYVNTTGDANSALGYFSLSNNTTGSNNTALGYTALFKNTSGSYNTSLGNKTLSNNTTGDYNIAIGDNAMFNNVNGGSNIGIGERALYNATTGFRNVALGQYAMSNNAGSDNVAVGPEALKSNTTGIANTAIGAKASSSNTTGSNNVSLGHFALFSNTDGFMNNAIGFQSLYNNSTGTNNSALGTYALRSNTTGSNNIAIGTSSLYYNVNAENNIALGNQALFYNTSGSGNIAIGYRSLRENLTGSFNTIIGDQAGVDVAATNLTNATAIGSGAIVAASNTIKLGNAAITNVSTNGTLTLGDVIYPNTSGNVNEFLTSNGSGLLSWKSSIPYGATVNGETLKWNATNNTWQATGYSSLALGNNAGITNQGANAISIGKNAGGTNQANNALALGTQSGYTNQGISSISIGTYAGYNNQANNAISIGFSAGAYAQGAYSIAIGANAGYSNQAAGSIVLNASGATLNGTNAGLYIAPIRNLSNSSNVLTYDPVTSEVSFNTNKTFVINHPTKSDSYLVHAALEGPEAGVYYRGEAKIENNKFVKITLPDYVSAFADNFTVQITQIYEEAQDDNIVFKTSRVKDNSFNVYGKNGSFYWVVFAQRGKVVVEPKKSEVELKGDGPYKYLKTKQ